MLSYFLDIIYIGKAQKHPKLILDNYIYQIHIAEPGKTRWRCKYQTKYKCRAYLYSTGNNVFVQNTHSHPTEQVNLDDLFPKKVKVIYNK